jgi:uracil-DNA glycosylase
VPELELPRGWRRPEIAAVAAGVLPEMSRYLHAERSRGPVHPPAGAEFRALELTPWDRVRVVILGQDPYHRPGQAHGLAFSVPPGVPAPPSLRNVLAELASDTGLPRPARGDLTPWARRGVLLLNTTLTVREGHPGSHAGRGWERLTGALLASLAAGREGLVYMLWGAHAQRAGEAAGLDRGGHLVLRAAHPSPLSARRGYFGCGHFSAAAAWFAARGEPALDWSLGDAGPGAAGG